MYQFVFIFGVSHQQVIACSAKSYCELIAKADFHLGDHKR
jgi:hypothetical protein